MDEEKALAQAKKNAETYFVVVGIYEDLMSFFQVLEQLLPQFFKSAPEIYKTTSKLGPINICPFLFIGNAETNNLLKIINFFFR